MQVEGERFVQTPYIVGGQKPAKWTPLTGRKEPRNLNIHKVNTIELANDVEKNPGPTICLQSHNVRGMKDYDKKKRILNQAHNLSKYDIGCIALQETHLDNTHKKTLDLMWRGK